MSTRPKPRPRPRPRPAAPSASTPQLGVSGSGEASETPPVQVIDEDSHFIKNRNRTAETWKKLNILSEANEKPKPKDDSDEDSSGESGGARRRKFKKTVKKKGDMPDWTKKPDAVLILSSDDELEDSILKRVDNTAVQRTPTKRKRPRSRSRSITPPPELPSTTLEHAREMVRQVLGGPARTPSPTYYEEEEDSVDIGLPPELANIVKKAEIEAKRQASIGPKRTPSPVDTGGPEIVQIKVYWKPHPLNPNAEPQTLGFKMRRHDSFRVMFNEIADSVSVLVDHLIVRYEGKRIYPSASPHGIGVWEEAELEACDKTTDEYRRAQRYTTPGFDDHRRSPSRATPPSATEMDDESVAGTEADSGAEDDDTMRLTFRAANRTEITLRVRRTTKCSAILKAYLKKAGLAEQFPGTPKAKGKKGKTTGPALVLDGEKLSPDAEIGTADLDDGDQVDVVGL